MEENNMNKESLETKNYKYKQIIGEQTLYLGDCLDVIPSLENFDLCLSDPPYGITNCKWDKL